MNDDLVKRLRGRGRDRAWRVGSAIMDAEDTMLKAADRIEALTAERDRQYDENVHRIFMQAKAETERDALQADNARLREALTVDPWGLGWRKWQAHAATVLNLSPGKETK